EAVMSQLDRVTQRPSIGLRRQKVEETAEIVSVEGLCGRELPVDRPQFLLEFKDTAGQKAPDRLARLGKHAAIGGEARPLDREDEALRRLLVPAPEALRLL